ncbi:50S ribosomal protein L6 [Spirochaetia bacterium]|nr:50S ribosomal protein L6 [Spirochaetia bacterium]GHU34925.1 50S ribosomal protein L6 [Spirochaetia bacterium]
MSRVGKIPIKIPQGVAINFQDEILAVEGPKGKLTVRYSPEVSFVSENGSITVNRANENKQTKAYHGLYRNLLNNMITGVSKGFTKTLIITGVGYKAEIQGKLLVLSLGYSSDIFVGVPEDLSVAVEAGGKLTITGIDKQRVGEFAAQIRKFREPEPYKGKGIRYEEEIIRRKVGKSGVK